MVLNMADFGKFWKSLQTPWNASKTLANRFLTPCGTFCIDLGWFRKGHKFAVFQQKPWAIAHGLKMADFGKFWKSLQTPWNASKTLANRFLTPCGTFCTDLGWFRKGHKFAVFQQKPWAIAHGFEHGGFWQVLEIAPNSLKRLQNGCK